MLWNEEASHHLLDCGTFKIWIDLPIKKKRIDLMILDRKCFFKQMGTILLSWQLLVGQIYQPISLNSLSSCHVCKLNKSLLVKVSTLFLSRSFQHATWAIKPVLVGTLPSFYHCRPYNVLVWACPHMSPTHSVLED